MPNWQPNRVSRPIQFDMVTLFVGTAVWALILTGMRLLGFPLRGYVIVSVLLAVVGISLVLFRNLGRPVSVSICCGIVVTALGGLLSGVVQGTPFRDIQLGLVAYGAAYGLVAFFVFDAVLILSEFVRYVLNRHPDE